jgi:hypothetical protein
MEQNRLWHEPVVGIFANLISIDDCSARAYDLANRRWYELNVRGTAQLLALASDRNSGSKDRQDKGPPATWDYRVPDDDWLSSTVAKHVGACYETTGSLPTWNIINTTPAGHPVTFEQAKENHRVGLPIYEFFFYGHKSSDRLPTIGFPDLTNKVYLSKAADYCDWKGRKCVFKRIEFDSDNTQYKQEIRIREHLIQQITQESADSTPFDVDNEMMRRFSVVPILGVVLHDDTSQCIIRERREYPLSDDEDDEKIGIESKEEEEEKEEEERVTKEVPAEEPNEAVQKSYTVAGFIMPYMGRSLDLIQAAYPHPTNDAEPNEASHHHLASMPAGPGSPDNTTADVPITLEQLLDLVKGVKELSRSGVTHGDLCYWNVVLETRHGAGAGPPGCRRPASTSSSAARPRLLLIDMGRSPPGYENDAAGLAGVLLWCARSSSRLREYPASRNKLIIASALLREGDFDGAIEVLSPAFVSDDGCESSSLRSGNVRGVKRRRLVNK